MSRPEYSEQMILDLISKGENDHIEFKLEDVRPEQLAKEIVAFANYQGGVLLLGVSDGGGIEGCNRTGIEEWVMNTCRQNCIPQIIPHFQMIAVQGKKVGLIDVPKGLSKPYQCSNGRYYIRVGSTSREASRDELGRLFQASGLVHYDLSPIQSSSIADLDLRKIQEYFLRFNDFDLMKEEEETVQRLLLNANILTESEQGIRVTVGGLLIFGKMPEIHLPHSQIHFAQFRGTEVTSMLFDKKYIPGTLFDLVDQTVKLIELRLPMPSEIEGVKRVDQSLIPHKVLREGIVNAVVHRNYSLMGSNTRVLLFDDRLEIHSPGRLPNSVTIEKMKVGFSAIRNPFLVKYMENMNYIDRLGRGIPMILKEMKKHNGIQPKLEESGEEFILTIYFKIPEFVE